MTRSQADLGLSTVVRGMRAERAELALLRISFGALLVTSLVVFAWITPGLPVGMTGGDYNERTLLALALVGITSAAWPFFLTVWWAKFRGESVPEFLRVLFGAKLLVRGRAQFQSRLRLECRRGERTPGYSFSVIVVQLPVEYRASSGGQEHPATLLVRGLIRSEDILGELDDRELALLSLGSRPVDRDGIVARLARELSAAPAVGECRIGSASFPDDGRTPEELLAAANASLASASLLTGVPNVVALRPPAWEPTAKAQDDLPEFLLRQLHPGQIPALRDEPAPGPAQKNEASARAA